MQKTTYLRPTAVGERVNGSWLVTRSGAQIAQSSETTRQAQTKTGKSTCVRKKYWKIQFMPFLVSVTTNGDFIQLIINGDCPFAIDIKIYVNCVMFFRVLKSKDVTEKLEWMVQRVVQAETACFAVGFDDPKRRVFF